MSPSFFRLFRDRRGFTLVELLVVIAIIGVLVALLLPAVQAAREAARRTQCNNNLKQIGLAIHNYHDTNNRLPPGAVFHGGAEEPWGGPINHRGSIHIRLLPYLEQQSLYDLFDLSRGTDNQAAPQPFQDGNTLLRSATVNVFLCPSDNSTQKLGDRPNQVQVSNYDFNMGPSAAISNSPSCDCPEFPLWQSYSRSGTSATNPAGPFTRNGWNFTARFADCIDGLSNTIFFGEVRVDCSNHVRRGWSDSNRWGKFTQIPINYDSCYASVAEAAAAGKTPCAARCNWNTEVGFKSRHPGGANFLLGDGSVRFIGETIDHWTYQYVGDRDSKQAAQLP